MPQQTSAICTIEPADAIHPACVVLSEEHIIRGLSVIADLKALMDKKNTPTKKDNSAKLAMAAATLSSGGSALEFKKSLCKLKREQVA